LVRRSQTAISPRYHCPSRPLHHRLLGLLCGPAAYPSRRL